MTHLPYHGDANAAAQDLLHCFDPEGAMSIATGIGPDDPHPEFWRDVATLLRLESQDDETEDEEADRHDAYEAAAYDEQYELVRKAFGKRTADQANYGWGVGGGDTSLSIATKVYGHGILQTELDLETGAMSHGWVE